MLQSENMNDWKIGTLIKEKRFGMELLKNWSDPDNPIQFSIAMPKYRIRTTEMVFENLPKETRKFYTKISSILLGTLVSI